MRELGFIASGSAVLAVIHFWGMGGWPLHSDGSRYHRVISWVIPLAFVAGLVLIATSFVQ